MFHNFQVQGRTYQKANLYVRPCCGKVRITLYKLSYEFFCRHLFFLGRNGQWFNLMDPVTLT